MKKPLILISNDDGVQAKGLNELIRMLHPIGDLVVMAPDSPRSGASCSLTVTTPVRYQLVREEEGITIYKCSGTPTDCIKLGLHTLKQTPDLIVGGINHGDNSAVNVHYSGTMGVVLEGCIKGIPSIGYSLCDHRPDAEFTPMTPYVVKITNAILQKGLPDGVCLNVNFPNATAYKGIKICRQTKGRWANEWAKQKHPKGYDYFWLTGEFVELEQAEDTDHWALNHNYVAITPTRIDVTDYEVMNEMRNWEL